MANFLENFGLGYMRDDLAKLFGTFMPYIVNEGKLIVGYGTIYTCLQVDSASFIVPSVISEEDGTLEMEGLDTHAEGFEWDLIVSNLADITPEDESHGSRVCVFERDGYSGMVPIHVVCADVLPSFLEGDRVKLQVAAFACEIVYYPDEESYEEAQPPVPNKEDSPNPEVWEILYGGGSKLLLADGMIYPTGWMYNHNPENMEGEKLCGDDLVGIRGTVVKVTEKTVRLSEDETSVYIQCAIDTFFGRLNIIHTLDQVDEKEHVNIKAGATVDGNFVLSGNAAIGEHERGIVFDSEHHLRAIRYAMTIGNARRAEYAFEINVTYQFDGAGEEYITREVLLDQLQSTYNVVEEKIFVWMATITSVDNGDAKPLPYGEGTRCLAIATTTEENYVAIIFIETSEDGKIEKLYESRNSRYHFSIDQP